MDWIRRHPWLTVLGLAAIAGATAATSSTVRSTVRQAAEQAFNLARNAYRSLADWAADRGRQIRAAFGVQILDMKPEGRTKLSDLTPDAWNRAKLSELNPAFRQNFIDFFEHASSVAAGHGKTLIIWYAARSLEKQVQLYAQGRTEPGNVVTYAVGNSNHLYGLAIDLAFWSPSGPDWDYPAWYVREILPLAAQHGLQSLYLKADFDKPHIEVPKAALPDAVKVAQRQVQNDFPGLT